MGAVFEFSINEMEVSRDVAYRNIESLLAYPEKLLVELEYDGLFVPDEVPSKEELRALLRNHVDVVYSCSTRDEGYFYVDDDRLFHITGGMSWGDSPNDVWDSYCICHALRLTRRVPLTFVADVP
jgi:hypothetical protein